MNINKNLVINISVGVIGAATGALGSWLYAKNHFGEIATQEIQSVKATYRKLSAEKPPLAAAAAELVQRAEQEETNRELIATAEAKAVELGYVPGLPNAVEHPAKDDVEVNVTVNVIDANADEEAFKEKANEPYLLTLDDYHDNKWDGKHETMNLIWWAGDQTLSNEAEEMVQDIEAVVGEKNLTYFGPRGMSGDDDTIYVCNPVSRTNYEVSRVEGKYGVEVLGIQG